MSEIPVPIISSPQDFNEEELYIDLESIVGQRLFLKCEGMNFAGSIKLKAAREMVAGAERDGLLKPGSILVESSSGNLGVALSMIAASKGYKFLCITDRRCNPATRSLIEALGGEVHVIETPAPDSEGGFLGARLRYIQSLCDSDDRYVSLNQYSNARNWQAHYRTTAPAIARTFPQLDVLFVGVGTAGTLMGCARYFKERHPHVRIVAVDAVGSVTFGAPAARRLIPGLGMGVRPPLVDESLTDEVTLVEETDTIRACRRLAAHGFLFGGSTGTVVSAAAEWLREHETPGLTAVAISPDFGERYLDSIYQSAWVEEHYGDEPLHTSADGNRKGKRNGHGNGHGSGRFGEGDARRERRYDESGARNALRFVNGGAGTEDRHDLGALQSGGESMLCRGRSTPTDS